MQKVSFCCVSSLDPRTHYWLLVFPILCFCAGAQKTWRPSLKAARQFHAHATSLISHATSRASSLHRWSIKQLILNDWAANNKSYTATLSKMLVRAFCLSEKAKMSKSNTQTWTCVPKGLFCPIRALNVWATEYKLFACDNFRNYIKSWIMNRA